MEKISTEARLVQENITGYEGYLVVKADGYQVKKLMIALEETKIGRLYDIDVLEKENTKISRKDLGFPERKCLLCDNPACQCGRSRKHSIEELRKKIYGIIWEEQLQRGVAAEISQALMEEVYTTPKPGLVDREDTGAHTDMNCQTFQKSTEAIAEDLAGNVCSRVFLGGRSGDAVSPSQRKRKKDGRKNVCCNRRSQYAQRNHFYDWHSCNSGRNFPEKFRNNRIGGCLPDQSGNDKKRVGTGSEKIKTKLGDHAWRKNLLPSGRERSPGTGDERISDSV